jgi:hypothetical protein
MVGALDLTRGPRMKQSDKDEDALTPEQLELLAQDRERWAHLNGGGHLDDWLGFGRGMVLRRTMAMKIADSNKPEGRRYNKAMTIRECDGLKRQAWPNGGFLRLIDFFARAHSLLDTFQCESVLHNMTRQASDTKIATICPLGKVCKGSYQAATRR